MMEYGTSVESCLAKWRDVEAETTKALGALSPEALERTIEHPAAAITGPLWEMCLLMIEHEIHHRGQLSAYLKMLGAEQPALLLR